MAAEKFNGLVNNGAHHTFSELLLGRNVLTVTGIPVFFFK